MMPWTAIMPVKPWALSKTRLKVSDVDRVCLARAFARDVLDVLAASDRVDQIIVVTAEPEMRSFAAVAGALVVTDRPLLGSDMLNQAVWAGGRWAAARAPGSPAVVVPADLASLSVSALDSALDLMLKQPQGFVPDAAGSGTTMISAADPAGLVPRYGDQSATRHSGAGLHPVLGVDPRVRRDVDNQVDLQMARRLGVGRYTAAALELTGTARDRPSRSRPLAERTIIATRTGVASDTRKER
jgi:2-phospho-L-lactate guanylyltransferase